MQTVGGVLEMLGGGTFMGLGALTEAGPLGISSEVSLPAIAGGSFLILNGADNAGTGLHNLFFNNQWSTLTQQSIGQGLSAVGVPDQYGNFLGNLVNSASMVAGGAYLFPLCPSEAVTAAEGGAFNAIGSTGKVGEQWLAQNLGGESQVFFNTSQGARYVDQFASGIANESKVGYQSLTPSIQLQISKDAELLNAGRVQGVDWHFFQSPVTGLGGPSQPLFNALQQNGINVIIH
jgi:hypothetical protein